MRVRILRIVSSLPQVVEVMCSAGSFQAVWTGEEEVQEGQDDDVELGLEVEPTWGSDLLLGAEPEGPPGAIIVRGHIEALDSGVTIRIGDGLILVDPGGVLPPDARLGAPVVLVDPVLSLWPCNY